jgi:hypothetical protein
MNEFLARYAITKTRTDCCALCQLSRVNNNTPIDAIEDKLEQLRVQMEANVEVGVTTGRGQTAVFTIISPGEDILEENLIQLGFNEIAHFPRRRGYPDIGVLKMMFKTL